MQPGLQPHNEKNYIIANSRGVLLIFHIKISLFITDNSVFLSSDGPIKIIKKKLVSS